MRIIIFLMVSVVFLACNVCFADEESEKLDLYIKAGDGTYLKLPVGSDIIISKENFRDWTHSTGGVSSLTDEGTAYFIGLDDQKYLLISQDVGQHKIIKFIKKTKNNESWFSSDTWGKSDAKYDFQKKFKSYDDYGK